MFERVLRFFIDNYKTNYALFFLLMAMGTYAYTLIPKEVSPTIEPETINVGGSYAGASPDLLNRIAVQEIEDLCRNIDGVDGITSTISPGRFHIELEIDRRADKNRISDDIKDAIALAAVNLPDDMDEPTIRGPGHTRGILQLSIRSSQMPRGELVELARTLKNRLLRIKDISDVTIFGDSDLFYEVLIDEQKVHTYGFGMSEVVQTFSELSNIFPLGEIDNAKERYYLSTQNGKKTASDLEATILDIGGRNIELREIATISKRYEDSKTLASMNGKNAITLSISQDPKGDAIEISDAISQLIKTLSSDKVVYDMRMDQSIIVKESLNIIIANIILGIILIALLSMVLINVRVAFIIALGIPTSFVMGAIYFYFTGNSINVNSLIGVLIAIGIIVDDAIVVSENIQQYIEKGFSPKEAAFYGTKEMAKPVTVASVTTLFSFIPLLMLSGTLGEIIRLIPIAFSALIVASLIESFIFLPIHAAHTLSPASRTLSWQRINALYALALEWLIRHQKVFLLLFFATVPALIYMEVKHSKFYMFEKFDTSSINITFKGSPENSLEDSLHVAQTIERDLLAQKDRFFATYISSTAGYRRTATGLTELYPNVGYVSIELEDKAPANIMDRYITPLLSPYESSKHRTRAKESQKIAADVRDWLKEQGYKKQFHLDEINVVEKGMKHNKADIMIGVVSSDYQKAIAAVKRIEAAFEKTEGIKYSGNNIRFGPKEIKLRINSYGEMLGLTEESVGRYVSNLYLSRKIGTIFDEQELVDVKLKSVNYQNTLEHFKNLEIPLKDGTFVPLREVCEFDMIESLEKLAKDDGETTFFCYANIDPSKTTTSEVLEFNAALFENLKKEGIKLKFKGEREQKETLETEMVLATALALVLIFIAMLYLFHSVRKTLIVMSVIPFSILGVYVGHDIMHLGISLPSLIGALGLAGVIVNDGIIMMATLGSTQSAQKIIDNATKRLRPIVLTSVTTIIGLASLIFFSSGQAVTFQPLAVALGYGLFWGTLLNLFYVPVFYGFLKR